MKQDESSDWGCSRLALNFSLGRKTSISKGKNQLFLVDHDCNQSQMVFYSSKARIGFTQGSTKRFNIKMWRPE